MSELNDRVKYCVVKANCRGPSFLSTRVNIGDGMDAWTCRHCQGYVLVPKGEIPQPDKREPGQ